MKTPLATIATLLLAVPLALAQGPETPPGPPGPTQKSLQEIWDKINTLETNVGSINADVRIPITSVPITISQPGSYYFAGNLEFTEPTGSAIIITASNVTLDLNGFTLSSTPAVTGNAISVTPTESPLVTIRNGFITGTTLISNIGSTWDVVPGGFNTGISSNFGANCHLSNLAISGCRLRGFNVISRASTLRNCRAMRNGDGGFFVANVGLLENCVATQNAGIGFSTSLCSLSKCSAYQNGTAGFSMNSGSAINCVANVNGEQGFLFPAGTSGVLAHCYAISNLGTNIDTGAASVTRTGNFPTP